MYKERNEHQTETNKGSKMDHKLTINNSKDKAKLVQKMAQKHIDYRPRSSDRAKNKTNMALSLLWTSVIGSILRALKTHSRTFWSRPFGKRLVYENGFTGFDITCRHQEVALSLTMSHSEGKTFTLFPVNQMTQFYRSKNILTEMSRLGVSKKVQNILKVNNISLLFWSKFLFRTVTELVNTSWHRWRIAT